jgi:hypothetical protein
MQYVFEKTGTVAAVSAEHNAASRNPVYYPVLEVELVTRFVGTR